MKNVVKEFKELVEVTEKLMGPGGCPWDKEQTLLSIRGSLLEEVYEVLEAIDTNNVPHLVEELGDLLYNVLFFCVLGEKEGKFTPSEVVSHIKNKLIERHPHVFGTSEVKDTESVIEQWERIKHSKRESLMDGIPKAMPALAKGLKIAGKLKASSQSQHFQTEKQLGELLWEIVVEAKSKGYNPEHALREKLFEEESKFRRAEKGAL